MRKITKWFSLFVLIICLVGVAFWQLFFAQNVNFYVVSVVILIASMIPFFVSLEVKRISSREITLIATMIAIAVVGRVAFCLIPQVKPIAAVVIVSAICLGAERGFIIGSFSAFISNFIFGQGYWTPFQMVALGTVGLITGLIFKVVKVNRITLSAVGFVLATVVYGIIVDLSTLFMAYGENITLEAVLSVYGAGALFSLTFGIATAVFLFLFGMTFIRKFDRIKTKYNLVQKNAMEN